VEERGAAAAAPLPPEPEEPEAEAEAEALCEREAEPVAEVEADELPPVVELVTTCAPSTVYARMEAISKYALA
jgi:hypothetical protein